MPVSRRISSVWTWPSTACSSTVMPGEPAVVLLEPEERSGVVEHDGTDRHERARAGSHEYVALLIVGHHGCGPFEFGGGLGVPAEPGQQFTAHTG